MAFAGIKRLQKHSFWLSLLIHLLILLAFVLHIVFVPVIPPQEKSPALDISSYVYHEPQNTMPSAAQTPLQKHAESAKDGIKKPATKPTLAAATPAPLSTPDQSHTAANTEAIHLIGDKHLPVKPLIKILGRALTSHLIYPRIAMDFNVKGTAMVGFTIHPDGTLTDVKLVKSSGADVLDQAALTGLKASSPLLKVSPYVPEAKFLVIGIVFR